MLTPVLMTLYFYVNQSRQMLMTFKSAAGLWRQDRWKPIVSGIFNLAVNITLVLALPGAYKLDGVIFSTILALLLIEIPWETRVVFTCYFDAAQARIYRRTHAQFAVAAVALGALAWLAVHAVLKNFPGIVPV